MDTFQDMVTSFDGMNDCHKAELNGIRKLCKEHVQQTFSTDKKNVSVHDSSFVVNDSFSSGLMRNEFSTFLPIEGG